MTRGSDRVFIILGPYTRSDFHIVIGRAKNKDLPRGFVPRVGLTEGHLTNTYRRALQFSSHNPGYAGGYN